MILAHRIRPLVSIWDVSQFDQFAAGHQAAFSLVAGPHTLRQPGRWRDPDVASEQNFNISFPVGRQAAAEAGDVWAQFQLAQRWRQGPARDSCSSAVSTVPDVFPSHCANVSFTAIWQKSLRFL